MPRGHPPIFVSQSISVDGVMGFLTIYNFIRCAACTKCELQRKICSPPTPVLMTPNYVIKSDRTKKCYLDDPA